MKNINLKTLLSFLKKIKKCKYCQQEPAVKDGACVLCAKIKHLL